MAATYWAAARSGTSSLGESKTESVRRVTGAGIGDALGTTHEFKSLSAPRFPALATGPLTGIVGGGPFRAVAGQVTDDTQMACCLYASLKSSARFDPADVAARYVAWSHVAFDIGTQTGNAIALMERRGLTLEAGREVWLKSGRNAAANGSLMRTAPIGALLAESVDERRRAALDESALTHYDPRCRLACAAFDAAIATAVCGSSDSGAMWQAALDEISIAADLIAGDYDGDFLKDAVSALEADLSAAREDDPLLYGPSLHIDRSQGFVRIAFRLAFWELLHAPTFSAAVLDAANRGGDADTNAAIVGALVGSRVGVDAIPADWRRAVLDCVADRSEAWSTTYHPRVFGC
jgi:ADP-ribosyl-[dinitrogen reductase] hydrolase